MRLRHKIIADAINRWLKIELTRNHNYKWWRRWPKESPENAARDIKTAQSSPMCVSACVCVCLCVLGEAGADCGVCAASRANTYISIEGSALKAGDETLTYFSISGLSNEWASHAETEDTDACFLFSLIRDHASAHFAQLVAKLHCAFTQRWMCWFVICLTLLHRVTLHLRMLQTSFLSSERGNKINSLSIVSCYRKLLCDRLTTLSTDLLWTSHALFEPEIVLLLLFGVSLTLALSQRVFPIPRSWPHTTNSMLGNVHAPCTSSHAVQREAHISVYDFTYIHFFLF